MTRAKPVMCAAALAFAAPAFAQSIPPDAPAFEVATVRENKSGDTRMHIEVQPGGRFNAINMTLWQIVSIAYPVDGRFRDEIQLTGGPAWMKSDRFDIVAKAEGSPTLDTNKPGTTVTDVDRDAVERIRLMLRGFLAERFQLRMHHEMRELPIYELMMAGGGTFGPALRKAAADCGSMCGSIRMTAPGRATGTAVSMGSTAHTMTGWVRRTVVDKTGIDGPMDFTLQWAPDGATDTDAPSIFTAVQEQLGLKLAPARGAVDVLVVDSAERPSPD
jgi:bla regulator protein BlaR1